MELVGIENSRIIFLTLVHRPSGQVYLPEAAAKLVQRYSFAKYPSLEELLKATQSFSMGTFKGVQIQDFSIYSDGVIVSSRSDTDILDAFLDDLFAWIASELGLVPVITDRPEKHYESTLVVKSETDLVLATKPAKDVVDAFNRIWHKKYFETDYAHSGFLLHCDASQFKGRRNPMHFVVERRLGVPFDQNLFFSTAPLSTKDHLDFLARLEDLARG
jgi:hypothetical protein